MPLGLLLGLERKLWKIKRMSTLKILTSKRGPKNFYKGVGCKPTGFHTRKGTYVVQQEKLPNYIVPDLTGFPLKPYVSLCQRPSKVEKALKTATAEANAAASK